MSGPSAEKVEAKVWSLHLKPTVCCFEHGRTVWAEWLMHVMKSRYILARIPKDAEVESKAKSRMLNHLRQRLTIMFEAGSFQTEILRRQNIVDI